MRISKSLTDEIVAHSRDDLPNECCGIVGGRDGELSTIYRARNAEGTWLRYSIDSQDLFRITQREIPDAGEEVTGIYHSHTKSEAYPSQTDVNLAEAWPEPLYLICSLEHADAPVVRAFAIRDGEVEEVELDAA
jgi:proteasome lid subunit RPN8/RPN11